MALMLSFRGALLAALAAVAEPHAHRFTSPEDHAPRNMQRFNKVHGRIAKARGMDVLMIVVDDLRAQLECSTERGFAKPAMHTPHLCELATKSLMLQRSHVAMATCGPSRASILTSRHPSTTRVWDTQSYWRNVSGNFTTIPQYFKEQGYMTVGMGKIFHGGQASGAVPQKPWKCQTCRGTNDADYSWTEPYFTPQKSIRGHGHAWLTNSLSPPSLLATRMSLLMYSGCPPTSGVPRVGHGSSSPRPRRYLKKRGS